MPTRFAFVGFRHPHIYDMFSRCQQREDVEVVACCEEDAATREELAAKGDVSVSHDDFGRMLEEAECEVVAVGDVYGRRCDLIVRALQAGRHVISDKPVCISLDELDRIEAAAREHQRIVGCMLDMRDLPAYLGIRQLIQSGEIGEVKAISFDGQHPLMYGKRPMWYFEPGMHGGTLNDIAIHAIDMIPWATGLRISSLVAARCWNGTVPQHPHFEECGQAMLTLENGAGVICDVSYLSPDSQGYTMPLYWRFTIWGDGGAIVAGVNRPTITLYKNGEESSREIPLPEALPGAYLDSFLREMRGETTGLHLSSAEVLQSTRTCLRIQAAADQQQTNVDLLN